MTTWSRADARGAALAVGVAVLLVVAAMLFPLLTGEDVRVYAAPLHAQPAGWSRIGPATLLPVVVGVLALTLWRRFADSLAWGRYLLAAFAVAWTWSISLSVSLGTQEGFARLYERQSEYLWDAVRVQDVGVMMHEFIDRIPHAHPENWGVHVAGHPPGALLFYVLLDRLGLGEPVTVSIIVTTLATTTVVAVALAVRFLAGEDLARRVAPWVAFAPIAVWMSQGDGWFMAAAAWGVALLALAATRPGPGGRALWGVAAGVVLGLCVYLSYGLVLLGVLCLAVLWLTRRWSVLPWALLGALAVAAAFTVAGFAWWEAYPVLVERYNAGVASERSYHYWVWANLAAWTFSAGLVTWAALPRALSRVRERDPVAVLVLAGVATILLATLSGMSKAEVERIWMPFTAWILLAGAFLPARWRTAGLATQLALGLVIKVFYIIPMILVSRAPG